MKLSNLILISAFAAASAVATTAQQSTPPPAQPAPALPDAPQATAAAMIHPNGPTVVMDTSMGRITCQFYQKQAPKAVANFIGLAEGTIDWTDPTTNKKQHRKPYYDNTTFHRVIPEFMIQGGDPAGTGMGGPGFSFDDEFDPNLNFDQPGRLAMANSGPNTNGSQFFVTVAATPWLDNRHSIFGEIVEGQDIANKISEMPRDSSDRPRTPVILQHVRIERV
jgi:peptidyl-prolyl cis-trans isomerase A (cyclophilin A)